jgi:hypothetical protein
VKNKAPTNCHTISSSEALDRVEPSVVPEKAEGSSHKTTPTSRAGSAQTIRVFSSEMAKIRPSCPEPSSRLR